MFRLFAICAATLLAIFGTADQALASPGGPPLETNQQTLAAALRCFEAARPVAAEPVLLVHGTSQTAAETWGWNYVPALTSVGIDVCTVDLPDGALGDIQTSTEYVVSAVREMRARYGSKIDILGFSQGTIEARWAVKYWPDVRDSVDDMVALATPYHGAGFSDAICAVGWCIPSMWQQRTNANFIATLNAGDETPGDISYTSIFSLTDEFVWPQAPHSVSEQQGAANVLAQGVCPGRIVDHVQETADALAYAVVIDAFTHPGPANPNRIDRRVCGEQLLPGLTPQTALPNYLENNLTAGPDFGGFTSPRVAAEPELRCYARPQGC